ncbi:MAG: tRNA 2-thiouridine(34) synthase MnmA [Firmicutes bacterium]|nr:tRNA 2-thiouridine(34) synthase MnmA [Bacillota bacterium]
MDLQRPALQAGEKIAVAMSGGVDSTVAALLLKEAGFKPVGVTLRFWVDPIAEKKAAAAGQSPRSPASIDSARETAAALGIPHHILDMQGAFYEQVVTTFIQEYRAGRTPNPCIACNKHLKFSHLLRQVQAMGINYLATGHYARIVYEPQNNLYRLLRAKDKAKEQSYMLYTLQQEQLKALLFPLGGRLKSEVVALARRKGLKAAQNKESYEICFIPDHDYHSFLEREHPGVLTPGEIVSTTGQKLGMHRGVAFYTVGQRKGLGLTARQPLYVVKIDPLRNTLIVGEEAETYSSYLWASELSFVAGTPPAQPLQIEVKIRYRAPQIPAVLHPPAGKQAKVVFNKKQKAVTPGQAVVFYRGEEVLGGGKIVSSEIDEKIGG